MRLGGIVAYHAHRQARLHTAGMQPRNFFPHLVPDVAGDKGSLDQFRHDPWSAVSQDIPV